jgi:hypothetical protein
MANLRWKFPFSNSPIAEFGFGYFVRHGVACRTAYVLQNIAQDDNVHGMGWDIVELLLHGAVDNLSVAVCSTGSNGGAWCKGRLRQ